MRLVIVNVNEENVVYDKFVVDYSKDGEWADFNTAMKEAIKSLADFPADTVRIYTPEEYLFEVERGVLELGDF